MVMFVCNVCGSSLKKNKVEEHCRFKCRRCESVSCMDCGKDFWGDEYATHYKCISEQEKYQGTPTDRKGDQKQEQWISNVCRVIEDYKGHYRVKTLLQKCVECPNLPRKQKKFVNFVKSSFHETNPAILEEAWSIIDKASSSSSTPQNQDRQVTNNNQSQSTTPTPTPQPSKDCGKSSDDVCNENKDDGDDEDKLASEEEEEAENNNDLEPNLNGMCDDSSQDSDSNDASAQNESDKLKKKKNKVQKKQELASLQNPDGKKMSKKQLKRLREESISNDLAPSEESTAALASNGHQLTKKDKKNKKKQRDHRESVHEVICENEENDQEDAEKPSWKKRDLLTQIQMDEKIMKGVPRNENIESVPADDDEGESEKPDRHFNWHRAIKSALKAEEDLSLPVKKLRKKVLAEFLNHGGDCKVKSENEIYAMFDKKLHTYPKLKILKDRVTFVK